MMEEDPEKGLSVTIDNLIKNKYYKDENGKWNIYHEDT